MNSDVFIFPVPFPSVGFPAPGVSFDPSGTPGRPAPVSYTHLYQKAVEAGGFESLNDLIETATDRIAAEVLGLTPEQYAAEVQAAAEKAKKKGEAT